MPRTDAVTAVTGELFEKGWSRVRGSMQGMGRQNQMARAARGHSPAIFKAIKSGGCHTKAQLRNQLEYLTTKSSYIVDSRSTYDGLARLDAEQITDVAERFSGMWNENFTPKMGHTTHMLMAYPVGTKGSDVRDMASEICERFFAQEGRQFDYLIAVHEDRAHPHAHIVLNRKSREGETFYLGKDHHFNYDDFRLAMVESAETRGIRLEATRRVERGITTYKAPLDEIYQAKREGRGPVERQRIGKDLDAALGQIARHSETYRFLSGEASRENREDVANALFRATEILARGGNLKSDGVIYMQNGENFDALVSEFRGKAERAEQMIVRAEPERRAALEKELNEIYQGVAHMNPLGERSGTLTTEASKAGVYSEANIVKENVDAMRDPRTRAEIDTALRGTGISSSEVISRVEAGASNAALERQWLADDLSKIAAREGINLNTRDGLEKATTRLDNVHADLGARLEDAGVIRDKGWTETERDALRAEREADDDLIERGDVVRLQTGTAAETERALGARMDREAEFQNDPERHAAMTRQARDDDYRDDVSGRLRTENGTEMAEREGTTRQEAIARREGTDGGDVAFREGVQAEINQLRMEGYDRAYISSRSVEIEERVAERLRAKAERTEAPRTAAIGPRAEEALSAMREDSVRRPFNDAVSEREFRDEIERDLTEEQVDRLRNGDADALRESVEDRLDRLYLTKTYLQSDEATANSEVMNEVVDEIVDAEVDAQRVRHGTTRGEKGITHA